MKKKQDYLPGCTAVSFIARSSAMANDFFRFKQFSIRHDRCAMKVGTDGVLLGAWGCTEGLSILDVGTGTGLIALMAAQRNLCAQVLGIDIDEAAVLQAQQNIAASPFSHRIGCKLQDVLTFRPDAPFDAILCNPPFFTEDTLPDDNGRALARNNRCLPFDKLIPKVATLLSAEGHFSIIVPSRLAQEIVALCLAEGLLLQRRCEVRTVLHKPPRRTLFTFVFSSSLPPDVEHSNLCLTAPDGSRSVAYSELTKAFYL